MAKPLNFRSQKKKGFTLLEMVISIGIFVLVATASSVVFNQALIAYRYTTSRMAAAREAALAMDWIMREIRKKTTVIDVPGGFPNIGTPFPIIANSDAAQITINHPPAEPGAITSIHYHLDAGDTRLWRERVNEPSSPHDLVAVNINALNFRYYDVNNNDVTGQPANINTANKVEITITTQVNGQTVTLYNVADR